MNIQQLKVIVELAKGKSLIEIGETMEITQPTVSFHIRKLEEEIGYRLYNKDRKNLVLTKACYELVPYASKILTLMEEAKEKVAIINQIEQSRIRIATSQTTATYYVPAYIQAFKQIYPDIELMLEVNHVDRALQFVRDELVDLAVLSLQQITDADLSVTPITEDTFVIAYSPFNRLATLSDISLEDIEQEMLLLQEEGTTSRRVTNDWIADNKLNISHSMQLSSSEMIKEGTKHNLGIGIIPERMILHELETGQLHALPLDKFSQTNEFQRSICIVTQSNTKLTDEIKAFIELAVLREQQN